MLKNKWVIRYETAPLKHRYTLYKHKFYIAALIKKKFFKSIEELLSLIVTNRMVRTRFWIEKASYKKNPLKDRFSKGGLVPSPNSITFK